MTKSVSYTALLVYLLAIVVGQDIHVQLEDQSLGPEIVPN